LISFTVKLIQIKLNRVYKMILTSRFHFSTVFYMINDKTNPNKLHRSFSKWPHSHVFKISSSGSKLVYFSPAMWCHSWFIDWHTTFLPLLPFPFLLFILLYCRCHPHSTNLFWMANFFNFCLCIGKRLKSYNQDIQKVKFLLLSILIFLLTLRGTSVLGFKE